MKNPPPFAAQRMGHPHNNPVKRGLVKNPADWPWSSFRFYYLSDTLMMEMDRISSMGWSSKQ